jgi:hypothetical protein
MKRASTLVLLLLPVLLLPAPAHARKGAAKTAAVANPLGVVVDSFTTAAGTYLTGDQITATAALRAGRSVTVAQVVAAVRSSQGGNYDFPAQRNVVLGTTARTLTFSGSLAVAGAYTIQMAYYDGTTWTSLGPIRTVTVAAPLTTNAPRSGVYTGWPQTPTTLDAFGTFRGRPVAMAADYLDSSSWATIEGPAWFTNTYRSTGYASKLVIGVPMLPNDDLSTSLAQGATGAYDAHFRQLAQNLVAAGLTNAVIRPGWEFNSPVNYRWSGVAKPAEFAGYFRHIVTAMRAVNPQFTFDLCFTVMVDGTRLDLSRAWPGDAYVDIIGMDLYDMTPGGGLTPTERWNRYLTAPGGLNYLKAFAAAHGKSMSFDEWALASPSWGGGGDSPYFIQAMYDWMRANPVAFETYNNTSYDYTTGRLDNGTYPLASAKYRALFGGR